MAPPDATSWQPGLIFYPEALALIKEPIRIQVWWITVKGLYISHDIPVPH